MCQCLIFAPRRRPEHLQAIFDIGQSDNVCAVEPELTGHHCEEYSKRTVRAPLPPRCPWPTMTSPLSSHWWPEPPRPWARISSAGSCAVWRRPCTLATRSSPSFTPPDGIRTLAFWSNGEIVDNIEYELPGTPCEEVICGGLCHIPFDLQARFPETKPGIESYLGVPLQGTDGTTFGHLCVLDRKNPLN